MAQDLYAVLGVPRGADKDSIKKAYKDLARRFHPDMNPSPKDAERFKDINAAYDVLGDDEKRKLYDEFGEVSLKPGFDADRARQYSGGFGGGGFGGGGPDLSDFINSMFGGQARGGFGDEGGFCGGYPGRSPAGQKGRDLEGEVSVDLLTVLRGDPVEVSVRRPVHNADGSVSMTTDPVKVRVPEGIEDGGVVRLRGKGAPGRGHGPAGDLLLKIHLAPHPYLRKEGDDLYMDVPITIHEAMAGGRIEVPTLDGSVRVKLPAGATSGQKMRLRGKGVRMARGRGDLFLVLRPTAPETDAAEALALAEKLEAFYAKDVRTDLVL